tara:strand:- start:586 stop:2226 length:1641 start_codon:yes stop_codon:yes gene_type:complete
MRVSGNIFLCFILFILSACQTAINIEIKSTNSEDELINHTAETTVVPEIVTVAEPEHQITVPIAKVEPIYENIWDRLRAGFSLERELSRERVNREVEWFKRNPEYVERVSKRAAPHLHYITEELEKNGLPMEFALLPIVESAFDPFAYSHSRAAGPWQFIPSTARLYGIDIDWWYDGRRDVRASTRAAVSYLKYLHKLFDGDWILALAAYNSGQGNILSAIRKSSLPRDQINFWRLDLLRETQSYVPRLLAISEIIANPEQYNMELPPVPNKPYWEEVDINGQLDLNVAASLAGISSEELYTLNAGFNQWATHPEGPHDLLIPIASVENFKLALKDLPAVQRVTWHRHKVSDGESLGILAQRFDTTVETIRNINKIKGTMIRVGDSLLIPTPNRGSSYNMTSSARLERKQIAIERSHGSPPIIHTIAAGDSLWEISRDYGVDMRELANWNGMGTRSKLYIGKELKIFVPRPAVGEPVTHTSQKPNTRRLRKLNYRVRNGESLSLIASKFNVSVADIESWNENLSTRKYIHPGERLVLYIDVTSQIN